MVKISALTRFVRREPVAFQGLVQAALAALVGFGVIRWSSEQVGLMLAVVAASLALFTRATVTPVSDSVHGDKDRAAGDPQVEVKAPIAG